MGPTLTLSGPWAKPPYKNPGTVGRCKISPSGITLNGLTLNLSAIMIIHCPTREDLSLDYKEQCCTLYSHGSRELKPFANILKP